MSTIDSVHSPFLVFLISDLLRIPVLTSLLSKLIDNQEITSEDWNQYLKDSHKQQPGMTPMAFSAHQTIEGFNSYQILSQEILTPIHKPISLLDLGCGDGHLFRYLVERVHPESTMYGLDMSNYELEIAKSNYLETNITFLLGNAQTIPLKDNTLDVVLSHMSFMLMTPITPVVDELKRVLKPGGAFSAVIGLRQNTTELYSSLQTVLKSFLHKHVPNLRDVKVGDSRTSTIDGLSNLFLDEGGFSKLERVEDFSLVMDVEVEEVWSIFRDMYFIDLMGKEYQIQLEKELISIAKCYMDSENRVQIDWPMRKFTFVK